MASLRDIKRRIEGVKNTRQITRAMKLVAGAKLRKATERAMSARPYQESLTRVLQRVATTAGEDAEQELLQSYDTVEKIAVVVFGTDRGLCGSFNSSIFRQTEKFIAEQKELGREVEIWLLGKKAPAYFNARKITADWSRQDIKSEDYLENVLELGERLTAKFTSGEVQEVYLAYNTFKSVLVQNPTFAKLLPLEVETSEETDASEDGSQIDYKYEPDPDVILDTLVPLYLQTIIHQAFLETEAGEHASRMTAMDNATRNASEIVDSLTLDYNRARQAAITTELIEIVSGAEAL
ncbi:MAG: ATP synthase F1 subunit gamma [Myxococcota bacterium]|nr:ATP synthase F1 subunit gamma [Myxococcota bacterium]